MKNFFGLAIFSLALAILGGGCGGASSAVATARTDSAVFALSAGQNALLTVKSQGGLTTGTISVPTSATLTTRTTGAISFVWPTGSVGFNGLVASDNTFRATGDVPSIGPFTLTGTLGAGVAAGGFSLLINGQRVSGGLARQ